MKIFFNNDFSFILFIIFSPDFRNTGAVGTLELGGMTMVGGTVQLVLAPRAVTRLVALSLRRNAEGAAVGAAARALELVLEALVAVAVRLVVAVDAAVRIPVADLGGMQADRTARVGALKLA